MPLGLSTPRSGRGLVIPVFFFIIIIFTPPSGRGLVIPFFLVVTCPRPPVFARPNKSSCRRSVNISTFFSRLASIRQNLHDKRCRKLLAIQWHKTFFDESVDEDASKL